MDKHTFSNGTTVGLGRVKYLDSDNEFIKRLAKPDVLFVIQDARNTFKGYIEWIKTNGIWTEVRVIMLEEVLKGNTKKAHTTDLDSLQYLLCRDSATLTILEGSGFSESLKYSDRKYTTLKVEV